MTAPPRFLQLSQEQAVPEQFPRLYQVAPSSRRAITTTRAPVRYWTVTDLNPLPSEVQPCLSHAGPVQVTTSTWMVPPTVSAAITFVPIVTAVTSMSERLPGDAPAGVEVAASDTPVISSTPSRAIGRLLRWFVC